jgi:hypothetical protein
MRKIKDPAVKIAKEENRKIVVKTAKVIPEIFIKSRLFS